MSQSLSTHTASPPHQQQTLVSDPEASAPRKPRRSAEELFETFGLMIAPILITLLGLGLFFYYRSLDIGGSSTRSTVTKALDWDSRLSVQIVQHLQISALCTLLVVLVAVPLGVLLTRPGMRKIAPAALTVANIGQATPAYGLLAIFLIPFGLGARTVIIALVFFAVLPVLRNTMVGLDGVDRNIIEAGRGMGLTRLQVLLRIELPLSVPIIVAGVRTAMVINIGMATLAVLIAGGGLGVSVYSGIKLQNDAVIYVSAGLVALVALSFDWLGAVAEKFLKPRGL